MWLSSPSIPNVDSLPYRYPKVGGIFFFLFQMTEKDDTPISQNHLMAALSVFTGRKKKKKKKKKHFKGL